MNFLLVQCVAPLKERIRDAFPTVNNVGLSAMQDPIFWRSEGRRVSEANEARDTAARFDAFEENN